MKDKKTNKQKTRKKELILIITLAILLAIAIIVILTLLHETNLAEDKDWLVENCKCVEYNGTLSCKEGWTLKNRTCYKEQAYTNVLISCSKYKCPEYEVNITE